VGKKEQKPLKDLIDILGVNFKDKSLLDKALLHRSYSSEHAIAKDNERLEFLGDSILNASVTIMLFKMFPDKDEGDLTKIKAKLVSRKSLKKWGEELGLEDYIKLGVRAKKFYDKRNSRILEDTMEAVIGALYLDSGFDVVNNLIKNYMRDRDFHKITDFKSRLQEYTVKKFEQIPEYAVLSETGPPHKKIFKIEVIINNENYGKGSGYSKKNAQQMAAKEAYNKLID
jgi:ribonuclease III